MKNLLGEMEIWGTIDEHDTVSNHAVVFRVVLPVQPNPAQIEFQFRQADETKEST